MQRILTTGPPGNFQDLFNKRAYMYLRLETNMHYFIPDWNGMFQSLEKWLWMSWVKSWCDFFLCSGAMHIDFAFYFEDFYLDGGGHSTLWIYTSSHGMTPISELWQEQLAVNQGCWHLEIAYKTLHFLPFNLKNKTHYRKLERYAAAAAKPLQSCPTLCNPIDGSPPGSPVPGILQARTLE